MTMPKFFCMGSDVSLQMSIRDLLISSSFQIMKIVVSKIQRNCLFVGTQISTYRYGALY